MGYLLTEIVVYLVIAGLIGFAFGWLVRAGTLNKYFDKLIELIKKILVGTKNLFKKVWELIKSLFGKVKSYISNLEIFKKSTKEAKNSDTNDEKFCLLTKIKELWSVYYLTLTTSKKVVKETEVEADDVTEKVTPEKIVEVTKEEVQVDAPIKEETKVEAVIEEVVETAKEVEVITPEETVETVYNAAKPTLYTETPAEGKDKLSSLKGIGPVLEKKLNELGVYTFAQIASWDTEQEVWIGTQMAFPKRVTKEEWVKQAKELLNK